MHNVFASVATWTAATRMHTQVSLNALKALQTEQVEAIVGTKTRGSETADSYGKLRDSELLTIKLRLSINELSVIALGMLQSWAWGTCKTCRCGY